MAVSQTQGMTGRDLADLLRGEWRGHNAPGADGKKV